MLPFTTMLVFGPYRQKRFGKARDRDAEVGARITVPVRVQVDAVASLHRHREEEAIGLETGAVDQHVGRVLLAVLGHDAARR